MKFTSIAAISLLAFGTVVTAPVASYAASASAMVKSVDMDKDGTIDMNEAKTAAMAKFAKLDKDKDGTIDSKEAGMDVSTVDADKDGTLDKTEYEAALTKTFDAADTDHDGTVDAKELASPEGKKLEKMM